MESERMRGMSVLPLEERMAAVALQTREMQAAHEAIVEELSKLDRAELLRMRAEREMRMTDLKAIRRVLELGLEEIEARGEAT